MPSQSTARLSVAAEPICAAAVSVIILGLIAITDSVTAIAVLTAGLALAAIASIVLLRFRPPFLAVLVLAFSLIAGHSVDATPLVDLAYAAVFFGFIAMSIAKHALVPVNKVPDLADLSIGVLVLCIGMGLFLSVALDADLQTAITEATAFSFILAYIPARAIATRGDSDTRFFLWAATALVLVLAMINFREYVLDMRKATKLWHIAVNRVTTNEHLFMMAGPAFLALYAMSRQSLHRQIGLVMFAVAAAAVVIGQSRAVWISFLLGIALAVTLMNSSERRRAVQLVLLLALAACLALVVFFWDAVQIIVVGLVHRFGTLATATETDISLINRFKENTAVLEAIKFSPFVGHGFAVPYSYYSLVYEATHRTPFVHNTVLGITYHVGLFGLMAVVALVGRVFLVSIRLARRASSALHRGLGLAVAAALASEMLSGMTEYSFGTAEKPLMIGIMAGLVIGSSRLRSASSNE